MSCLKTYPVMELSIRFLNLHAVLVQPMKEISIALLISAFLAGCHRVADVETFRKEIIQTERSFEKMTQEKSIAEAFYAFADSAAVINRGNDSLIYGREAILNYYLTRNLKQATVQWMPDFVAVSDDGTLGYTFGNYTWKVVKAPGDTLISRGVFHTVWKRQADGSWKYVWD